MSDYHRVIKISGTEQAVEQAIHELKKESDNAQRYGVELSVERLDVESGNPAEFNSGDEL